jgi:peptidoglycan/xylan/chitin deacetylase (PgdA/CDA1 family)
MADKHVLNVLFHGIGTPQRELEPGEDEYWITEDAFHAILDEVASWPSVRISFDDSNSSDVEIGLPALLERSLRADFFILAGRLDGKGSLGPDEVRELLRQGMGIGSHGMHHVSWRGMDEQTTHRELVTARERLAEVIGGPVDTAACPLGRYDRKALSDLRRLGYRHVFTSDRRPANPGSWLQPRYSVRHGDTVESMRAQVLARPGLAARATGTAKAVVKRWR